MTPSNGPTAGEDAPTDTVTRSQRVGDLFASPMSAAVLAAVATGLIWATAHPGPSVWWLIFFVVPGWLTVAHLARAASARRVALLGFLLGMAAFLPMLRWIAAPATSLGWVVLATTQAIWVALATVAVRPWTGRRSVALVGPIIWTAMEVLRARLPLTGFGWGDLATAHTDSSWMLTTARVLGADGLTLLTALLGAMIWVSAVAAKPYWEGSEGKDHGPTVVPVVARIVEVFDGIRPTLMGAVLVGALGTLIVVEPLAPIGELDVLVVQGNDGKNTFRGAEEDLRLATNHSDATIAAIAEGGVPDLTVWAENALDADPGTPAGAPLLPPLQAAAAAAEGRLIAGVLRAGDDPLTFRNSIATVDVDGVLGEAYDKQEVVPFGEYVPWRSVIGDFPPLRQVPRDAIAGDGPVTLEVAGVKIAPVICFETLFAPTVHAAVTLDDAGIIVAGTNDASFGRGAESAQHVNQSRLRAVETGRSVVHAAISGTSAIITPDGVIVEVAPMFEVATIRATVPVVSGRTPASYVARPLSLVLAAAGLLLSAGGLWHRRRTTDTSTSEPDGSPT